MTGLTRETPKRSHAKTLYQAVAARVSKWRQEKGLTQKTMAKMAGLKPDAIHRVESGDGGAVVATYIKVANLMGLTVGQLFDGTV